MAVFLHCPFRLAIFALRGLSSETCLAACMAMSLSVGLCMSVHMSKTSRPNFTTYSVRVNCGHSSVLLWRQCNMLCISSLEAHVIAHNRPGKATTIQRICSKWLSRWRHRARSLMYRTALISNLILGLIFSDYVAKWRIFMRLHKGPHFALSVRSGLVMVALCNRADHYIFFLFFSFFFLSFFSSPNLSGRRLDVYHTSAHGVALMQI